jgi:hypothetical protein
MGGNLFKNTSSINKTYIKNTVESLFNEHLSVLGVQRYSYIGSTGKSNVSGDIDLCISCSPLNKTTLTKRLQARIGENNVKISGQNIAVKYPISGFHNHYVQIDLMLAEKDKLDDVTWLMSGDGDHGVKGVYRNLMLCHIAKKISNKMPDNEKITISFPGGLQYKQLKGKKWVGKNEKITNPHQILKALRINKGPEIITTYTQFVDYMIGDKVLKSYLDDFHNYINNYIVSDTENANKALWYIKTKKRLKNEREIA